MIMNSNHASTPQRRLLQASAFMLYAFALGLITNLHAASGPVTFISTPITNNYAARKVTPTNTVEAKVLVVNRDDQTFTVEYSGKMQLFRIEHGAKIYDAKGKQTTLDWVTAGQTVSLQVQEYTPGRVSLLTAAVLPNKGPAEAAGWSYTKAERKLKKANSQPQAAPEPVVFPSEDARNTPVEINDTDKDYPTPEQPKVENPAPTENPAPSQEPKGEPEKQPEPKQDNQS